LSQKEVLMELKKEREELIEMFGVYFESLYHLPPLASRILANLIIDGYKTSLTFETLVARLGASKSSVSTNLNFLLKTGKITYYTLAGDRKKYFKSAPLSERINNYLKMIDFEKEIIEKLTVYREKTISSPEEQLELSNIQAYKLHILEMEELLLKTINQFKAIEKKQS
jgi:DNA-binding transcriptional regulator GbsR (MarR family)